MISSLKFKRCFFLDAEALSMNSAVVAYSITRQVDKGRSMHVKPAAASEGVSLLPGRGATWQEWVSGVGADPASHNPTCHSTSTHPTMAVLKMMLCIFLKGSQ